MIVYDSDKDARIHYIGEVVVTLLMAMLNLAVRF